MSRATRAALGERRRLGLGGARLAQLVDERLGRDLALAQLAQAAG